MDWAQVLTVFAIMATNLITVITLYIHSDNKMNGILKEIADESKAFNEKMAALRVDMYNESKDFHGRLVAIEERRNKILERP